MSRPITFLSDYGNRDEFAGVCRAVIAGIAPGTEVIDLTHGIPPGDVRRGAIALADAVTYAPPGVHLAVVDPGVGGPRRAVAVRASQEERVLVGPDNGLLAPALERLGGPVEAVSLDETPWRLEPISATFHGRDLFAPAAARLAAGATPSEGGDPIDVSSLATLALPSPELGAGRLRAHALSIDTFGNVALDASRDDLVAAGLFGAETLTVEAGSRRMVARVARTFADAQGTELVLYEDSSLRIALAINAGSAADALGVSLHDGLTIRRQSETGGVEREPEVNGE